MKYLVVYEFESTLENKVFNSQEEVDSFLKDEDNTLCLDGDFVKYYVIKGEFELTGGFLDRT